MQDTVRVVPSYPYSIKEHQHDIALEDCWHALLQHFFTCYLCPKDRILPKNSSYKTNDIKYSLVFLSTFEELHLPIKGPMEDAEVIKLYEPSPTPCLCVATAKNMVGRVPLTPLFLAGNTTPQSLTSAVSTYPVDCADTAVENGRR